MKKGYDDILWQESINMCDTYLVLYRTTEHSPCLFYCMIDHGFKMWTNSPQNIMHVSLCFAVLEHSIMIVGFIGWAV